MEIKQRKKQHDLFPQIPLLVKQAITISLYRPVKTRRHQYRCNLYEEVVQGLVQHRNFDQGVLVEIRVARLEDFAEDTLQ